MFTPSSTIALPDCESRRAPSGPQGGTGLRVLFLADAVFEDLPGGSRTAARELARGLAARGHSVTFLVGRQNGDAPDDEARDNVRIVRYPGAGRGAMFVREGRRAAARLWAAGAFDLVHTHFAYAALGPLRAIPRAVPRVRTFHGPWDEEAWMEETRGAPGTAGWLLAWAKRRARGLVEASDVRGSGRVLTLSECFHQRVVFRFGVAPERVETIPGGTDTQRFVPARDRPDTRRRLGLPPDRRLLLSVRRLAPRMGLDRLIAALPAVVARHPDVLLLIGGQGAERARLEAQVRGLGLTGHVRLLGFIPEEQLAAYYGASDLFVLPSLALEGFGLVTTEALACGVPVVGTPVGATPEILAALDPRLLARGTTPAALSEAILGFLEGSWAASLTPNRLHGFVQGRYTWERHVAATEAVYHRLRAGFAEQNERLVHFGTESA